MQATQISKHQINYKFYYFYYIYKLHNQIVSKKTLTSLPTSTDFYLLTFA